jgi:putative DNA primase/helicase
MRAAEIHARLGASWPALLEQLGVPGIGSRKPRPCPACGGRDRFVGDNRHGRGDYFCRRCGAGDGFRLLMKVHGWTFAEARKRVLAAAGIEQARSAHAPIARPAGAAEQRPAGVTARVRDIRRGTCEPGDVAGVRDYLASRALWPLPVGCTLRAHASLEYWEERRRIGRYAGLVADVTDLAGELVTVHVTYLQGGSKLEQCEPRKILSPMTGRSGCAVRLVPSAGDALGIAEGLETALSAHRLHDLPVWAALNTSLLQKFEPPKEVRRLVIFADRDAPGLEAAARLVERLQGHVGIEIRVPPPPANDWNDVSRNHSGRGEAA